MATRKTKRLFIPSSLQSRYIGLLKKMGGDSLVNQGRAVLAQVRARRPFKTQAAAAPAPAGVLELAQRIQGCGKLNGERAIAECVAACLGLIKGKGPCGPCAAAKAAKAAKPSMN